MICEMRNWLDKWTCYFIGEKPTPASEANLKELLTELGYFVAFGVAMPICLMIMIVTPLYRRLVPMFQKKYYCKNAAALKKDGEKRRKGDGK